MFYVLVLKGFTILDQFIQCLVSVIRLRIESVSGSGLDLYPDPDWIGVWISIQP